jgi:hypothetical protein
METHVSPKLVGFMRWNQPEYLVSRVSRSLECWEQSEWTKIDKILHPKDVRAIDDALEERKEKQEKQKALKEEKAQE